MQSKPFGELADGRSNNYDFLRFLFAALVIFGHSFIFVGFVEPFAWKHTVFGHHFAFTGQVIDPFSWMSLQQTWSGDIAVDGFFAISGCLVTASFLRSRGVLDYFKKRALRIYPGFLMATAVCLLIVGPLATPHVGHYFRSVHWGSAVSDMVQLKKIQHVDAFAATKGIQPMDPAVLNELDGPMWSIRIEFECYILVAVLGVLGIWRSRLVREAMHRNWSAAKPLNVISDRACVLILFVVAYVIYVATSPAYRPVYHFQTSLYHSLAAVIGPIQLAAAHAPQFVLRVGHVLDWPIRHLSGRQDIYDHIRCVTCFLAGMCFYLYRDVIPRSAKLAWASLVGLAVVILLDHIDIGIPIFAGYLMFYGAYNANWKLDRWGEKHDLSYGLYLYGWPAQALVVYYLGTNLNTYTVFAMAMAVASLCALAKLAIHRGSRSPAQEPQEAFAASCRQNR